MAWLKDRNDVAVPSLLNSTDEDIEEKMELIVKYHDRIIKCIIDEDEEEALKDDLERFQTHSCTFTCHKQKKNVTIR